jgi:DNA polymerase eta
VSILSRKGVCERASIDEVYLDLTEAAKERMTQMPESRDDVSPEAQKSHILGNAVGDTFGAKLSCADKYVGKRDGKVTLVKT